MLRLFFALAALAVATGLTPASPPETQAAQKAKFGGTAECNVRCKDGTCKCEKVYVSGYLTLEDAKRDAKLKLEIIARDQGGKIEGEIKFSIELKL